MRMISAAASVLAVFGFALAMPQQLKAGWGTPIPQAERVDRPGKAGGASSWGGGTVKRTGGAPSVEPIGWNKPDSSALENAQNGDKPILIFFPGEAADQNADGYMADKDTKALVDAKAVFVRVPYTSDREKAPGSDSPVPICRLTSDNPTRDYGVRAYPAFVVADKFGNEFYRIEGKKPSAKELESFFDGVAKKVEDTSKKLQKSLDAANKSWTNKDRKAALSSTMKAFKDGFVGYEPAEGFKRLYNELMDDARAEITKLADAKDAKALKALKSSLKGTDAEKDADAAIKGLAS